MANGEIDAGDNGVRRRVRRFIRDLLLAPENTPLMTNFRIIVTSGVADTEPTELLGFQFLVMLEQRMGLSAGTLTRATRSTRCPWPA